MTAKNWSASVRKRYYEGQLLAKFEDIWNSSHSALLRSHTKEKFAQIACELRKRDAGVVGGVDHYLSVKGAGGWPQGSYSDIGRDFFWACDYFHEYYKDKENVIRVYANKDCVVHVVGDTHGCYNCFQTAVFDLGLEKGNKVIFNGDFVDRGTRSMQIIVHMAQLSQAFPGQVHLNRGNHECISQSIAPGGVKHELRNTYETDTDYVHAIMCLKFYKILPLAHVVDDDFFVVHAGIPRDTTLRIADLNELDRFHPLAENSNNRAMADLLWSDPSLSSKRVSPRGPSSALFTEVMTELFLSKNKLIGIIRSHEMCMRGLKIDHSGRCLTVISHCPPQDNVSGHTVLTIRKKSNRSTVMAHDYPQIRHSEGSRNHFRKNGMTEKEIDNLRLNILPKEYNPSLDRIFKIYTTVDQKMTRHVATYPHDGSKPIVNHSLLFRYSPKFRLEMAKRLAAQKASSSSSDSSPSPSPSPV